MPFFARSVSFERYTGLIEDEFFVALFIQYLCLCNIFVDWMGLISVLKRMVLIGCTIS
jgi:hypothetical protein